MAHAAHDLELVDGDELEGDGVEEEGAHGGKILACVRDVDVVDGEGDEGVVEDPNMLGPCSHVGDLLGLLVHGDLLVEVFGVHTEDLVEPVIDGPLGAIQPAPGGLHRILGIRVCTAHDGRGRVVLNSFARISLWGEEGVDGYIGLEGRDFHTAAGGHLRTQRQVPHVDRM